MFLQPREDGEFEQTYKGFVPSEGEIRYIANKNQQCSYYLHGIDNCRNNMLKVAGNPSSENHKLGFLPCKRLVDAHFRCMTDQKFGYTLEEAPASTEKSISQFFQCAFQKLEPIQNCRKHFDSIVRDIYRSSANSLDDSN